jgi:HK97 family phage prohead protease
MTIFLFFPGALILCQQKRKGMTFILSDSDSVNIYGYRVLLSGMDLGRFKDNPVMLYNHNYEQVIGRWENIRIEDGRLCADPVFDHADPLGATISRKVEEGFIRGASLGIMRLAFQEGADHVQEVSRCELMEVSIVSVPADAGALAYDDEYRPLSADAFAKTFFNNKSNLKGMNGLELTAATLSALGVSGEATSQGVEQAVTGLTQKVNDLQARLSAMEQEKIERIVDQAIAAKKIGADERETYMTLAAKDCAGVEKILAKMPGVQPVTGQLNTQGAAGKYEGKTWDELDKAGLLSALKAEAPEVYRQMYGERFGVKN